MIKTLREQAGLTQRQLATLTGVDRSTISKWEHNISTPKAKTKIKLALIFSVNLTDLEKP